MPLTLQRRDYVMELAEALDAELGKHVVSLPAIRAISRDLTTAAERDLWRLKLIADIANHARPALHTLRAVRLLTDMPNDGTDIPPAA